MRMGHYYFETSDSTSFLKDVLTITLALTLLSAFTNQERQDLVTEYKWQRWHHRLWWPWKSTNAIYSQSKTKSGSNLWPPNWVEAKMTWYKVMVAMNSWATLESSTKKGNLNSPSTINLSNSITTPQMRLSSAWRDTAVFDAKSLLCK